MEYEKYHLNYENALKYFEADADMLKYLKKLNEDEKENLHLELVICHKERSVIWRMGHWHKDTENLFQLGNGIDNTTDHEDDYDAVVELIKKYGWKSSEI